MVPRFLYAALLLFFVACAVPAVNDENQPDGTFFDLKGFFEQEAAYLTDQNIQVQKTIRQNGKEEKQQIAIKDWTQELRFFAESDINKPSWRDQYTIDTLHGENKMTLKYRSKDEDLSTQALDIELVAGTVQHILVTRNVDNQVYNSQQILTYVPKKLYKIYQTQNIVLLSEDDYSIEANYVYE